MIEKTERARILETILKEKIPHFDQTEYFDHFQMEDRFDDPETDATLRFKDQIRKKDEKVRELEAKVKDLESMMSYFDVSGSKYVPESGKKMQRGELMSPLKTNSISMNLNKVDKAHDRVMELLNTVHNIDNNVKQDVCSIVEKVESQNHILCQKIDKLKAKFSSFINEFKKAAVKDLGSLETSLEDLISKAVSGEKEETNLLNVDMIKVLSYLHMDNRKLKIELKAIKEDFVQRENEWVDQKESMKEKIETYSEKINRLRKVLGKFLTSCNKEKDADETLVKSRSSEEVDSELDQPSNERITLKPLENQRVKTSIEFRDEYSSMRDRENDEKNYHQVKKAVKRTSRTPPKPFK